MTTPAHSPSNNNKFLDIVSLVAATLANTATKVATIIAARRTATMSHIQLIMITGSLVYGITSRYYGIQLKGQPFPKAIAQLESATTTVSDPSAHSKADSPTQEPTMITNRTESTLPTPHDRDYPPLALTAPDKQKHAWPSFLCLSAPCALMIGLSTVSSIMTLIRDYIPGYSDYFHQAHLPQTNPTDTRLLAFAITLALLVCFGLPTAYQFFLYRMHNIPNDLPKLANWVCKQKKPEDTFYWLKLLIALIFISSNLFVLGTTSFFNTEVLSAKFICEFEFLFSYTNFNGTVAHPALQANLTRPDTYIVDHCTEQLKPVFKWLATIITIAGASITLAGCNSFIQLLDLKRLYNLKRELKSQSYTTLLFFALLCYPAQHLGFNSLSSAASTMPSLNNWFGLTSTAIVILLLTSAIFDAIGKWFPSTTETERAINKLLRQCLNTRTQQNQPIQLYPHKGWIKITAEIATALELTSPEPQLHPTYHSISDNNNAAAALRQAATEARMYRPDADAADTAAAEDRLSHSLLPRHSKQKHHTVRFGIFFESITKKLLKKAGVPTLNESQQATLSLPAPLYFRFSKRLSITPQDRNKLEYYDKHNSCIQKSDFWRTRHLTSTECLGEVKSNTASAPTNNSIETLLQQPHHAVADSYHIHVYCPPTNIEEGSAPAQSN